MTNLTVKEFFAAAGSRFSSADAVVIGPVLQELATEGNVTAGEVVEAAKSSNSPLHRYFEWDNMKAAGLYREDQARDMIHAIQVRVVVNEQEQEQRAYTVPRANRGKYGTNEGGTARPFQVEGEEAAAVKRAATTAVEELRAWGLNRAAASIEELARWRQKHNIEVDEWRRFTAIHRGLSSIMEIIRDLETPEHTAAVLPTAPEAANDGAGIAPVDRCALYLKQNGRRVEPSGDTAMPYRIDGDLMPKGEIIKLAQLLFNAKKQRAGR